MDTRSDRTIDVTKQNKNKSWVGHCCWNSIILVELSLEVAEIMVWIRRRKDKRRDSREGKGDRGRGRPKKNGDGSLKDRFEGMWS